MGYNSVVKKYAEKLFQRLNNDWEREMKHFYADMPEWLFGFFTRKGSSKSSYATFCKSSYLPYSLESIPTFLLVPEQVWGGRGWFLLFLGQMSMLFAAGIFDQKWVIHFIDSPGVMQGVML